MKKIYFYICLVAILASTHAQTAEYDLAGAQQVLVPATTGLEEDEVSNIENWLKDLDSDQKEKAEEIIEETRPQVQALSSRIREKMVELESLSYDQSTAPETLPRLGQELQELRDALRTTLHSLHKRMQQEVGTGPGMPRTRGCNMRHVHVLFEDEDTP